MSTYNGWTNYETWAVNLWLDNDRGSYDYWLERSKANNTGSREDKFRLRQELETWLREAMPDLGATLWSDLLQAALDEANILEIVEHWLDDTEEEGGICNSE